MAISICTLPSVVKNFMACHMHVLEQQVIHASNLSDGRSMQLVIFVLFVRRRCMPQSYYVVNIFSVKTVYQSGETCFAVVYLVYWPA